MNKKNQALRCSQQIRNIPLERFRLASDGRKWRQAARSRSDLLVRLSTYANGDGTFLRNGRNYSPSLETLTKHVAEKSYFRITNALQKLGLLSWTREKHYERRIYTIHLSGPLQDSKGNHLSGSLETPVRLDAKTKNHLSDSPEHLSDWPKSPVTMGDHPSLPSEEPSKERAGNQTAPFLSEPKTSGQEKTVRSEADTKSLLSDIKKTALSASGNLAKFYRKDSDAIIEILRDNPHYERAMILLVVRLMVADMPDAFALSKAGADIAEMLIPRLEQRVEYLTEQTRAEQVSDAWLATEKQKSDARLAEIRKQAALPKQTGEDLFGAAVVEDLVGA